MLDWLFKRKTSAVGRILRVFGLGNPEWTPKQYDKLAEASYMRNVIAYRAIATTARSIASIPIMVKNDKDKEIKNHSVLSLLKRPNPQQSWKKLTGNAIAYGRISGNLYIELARQGSVTELYAHRPDRMRIVPSALGTVDKYLYSANGREIPFEMDPVTGKGPILHIKEFNPTNDWYGMGPTQPVGFSIDAHNEAQNWNKRLLQNSGQPPGMIVYKPTPEMNQTLTDAQYKRLEKMIEENMTGSENAGKPFVGDAGIEWVPLALNPAEMSWLEGNKVNALYIAGGYGVPGHMIGIEDPTYANFEEARLSFYEETVLPLGDEYLEELSAFLARSGLMGDNERLAFDLDEIPALYPRRKEKYDMVVNADFLTINEKRTALGYEPLAEAMADTLLVPSGVTPIDEAGLQPEQDNFDNQDNAPPKSKGKGK